ncbi:MAG: hypothetical protein RL017_68, partial [Pseudomonadota bacterium]
MHSMTGLKKPSLFSAIALGVGSIIGSGWLFASYNAAKFAGPIAILAWIFGAIIALLIALLLAEVATMFHKEKSLFSRLLAISHNRDYGFIIAISNWCSMVVAIPAEAEATMQYLAEVIPDFHNKIFINNEFSAIGLVFVCFTIIVYGILNYWGVMLLTKANNAITIIKLIVPAATAIIFLITAWHPINFTAFHNTIAPYGYDKAFTAVVSCGIFYSFYGFSMITIFVRELDNPTRNIPLALTSSVIICLLIYILLQISFIGAMDTNAIVTNGWHTLNFTSPLAQLAIVLNINWLSIILYADAAVSPSGTAIIYTGSSARMLTGLAHDGQMPKIFKREHPKHNISRLSIIINLTLCFTLVVFFKNWEKIMLVVSVFQLISCVAVPVCFSKLRKTNSTQERTFIMPFGPVLSFFTYLIISYLLLQAGNKALTLALVCHLIFFTVYCSVYYRNLKSTFYAFASSWTMFAYMAIITLFSFLHEMQIFSETAFI